MRTTKQVNTILSTENNLIQFEVNRPYDGCFWCWEYAFVNNGKIHFLKFGHKDWNDDLNIINSKSYNGFNTERSCKCDLIGCLTSNEHCYVYNTDKKSIKEFIKTSHFNDVHNVATVLENKFDIVLTTKCSCGNECEIHSMISTGYHGDGGIGVVHTGYVCDECYSLGSCTECGEYVGQEELHHTDEGSYCEYCSPNTCTVCDEKTKNSNGLCDDCQEEYAEQIAEFEQRAADYNALQQTPTFEGINLTPSKLEFTIN